MVFGFTSIPTIIHRYTFMYSKGSEAKIHLEPELLIKDNYGFKSQELAKILKIIEQEYEYIKQKWDETYNQ